jgi:hypothetical protein
MLFYVFFIKLIHFTSLPGTVCFEPEVSSIDMPNINFQGEIPLTIRPLQLAYLTYARPTEKTKSAKDKLILLNNV